MYFGCYFRWRGVIRVLKKGCELLRFPASPICLLSLYFCPFACFFFFLHTCFSPCGAPSSSTPSVRVCKFKIIPPFCLLITSSQLYLSMLNQGYLINTKYTIYFYVIMLSFTCTFVCVIGFSQYIIIKGVYSLSLQCNLFPYANFPVFIFFIIINK